VSAVAISPDGARLASAGYDKKVIVWDPVSGDRLQTLTGHQEPVTSVSFLRDSHILCSSSADDTTRIWDADTGCCLGIFAAFPEGWVAFRPAGRFRIGGDVAGGFWHAIGLCRFEPGELDPYLDQPLRLADDEPLIPELANRG
jgi:WD40 repeat protein